VHDGLFLVVIFLVEPEKDLQDLLQMKKNEDDHLEYHIGVACFPRFPFFHRARITIIDAKKGTEHVSSHLPTGLQESGGDL